MYTIFWKLSKGVGFGLQGAQPLQGVQALQGVQTRNL